VLLSLLKLTRSGPVRRELLAKHANVPAQTTDQLLGELFQSGLLQKYGGVIKASPSQRIKMAMRALKLAADFERVCTLLSWTEFENIAAQAFEANGYRVINNFHFKLESKRWEIDILGLKKPLILCVDCKHWKRGWRKAATAKAVDAQATRTEALAKALPNYSQKARIEEWETATLIPIVMSLTPGPYRFYNDVPVVPVLQLQDFINELPAQAHLLKNFHQKHVKVDAKLPKFSQ